MRMTISFCPADGRVKSPSQLAAPVRFGLNPYDRLEPDLYNPKPDAKQAQGILKFQAPNPKPWFQHMALLGNRFFSLPKQGVTPVLSAEDAALLRNLPKDAGNILVGPHPDWPDGNLATDLFRVAGKVPAGMFMAAETFQRKGAIGKALMSWYGVIPVRRGEKSGEAKQYLIDKVAQGGWGQIFPEGAIYYSRQVMPMEYGFMDISVKAALKAQEEAEQKGTPLRPILVTPFVHTYRHTNPAQMKRKMLESLAKLEKHPDAFNQVQQGDLIPRIQNVARRIMESRAKQYGIAPEVFASPDIYTSAHQLETHLIEALEQKYFGKTSEGFSRRRAMKIKMKAYTLLAETPNLSPDAIKILKQDIQKSLDVITLVSFDETYKGRFNDLETWGEFLRRLNGAVGLPEGPYGHRKALIKMLPPKDIHPLAKAYQAIQGEDAKMEYLFKLTEDLRQEIQQGVDTLCQQPLPL